MQQKIIELIKDQTNPIIIASIIKAHIEHIDCLYNFILKLPFEENFQNTIFLQCKMLNVKISHLSIVKHLIHNSENINLPKQDKTAMDLIIEKGNKNFLDIINNYNLNTFFTSEDKIKLVESHTVINNIEKEKQAFIDLLTPICEKVKQNGNSTNVQELISLLPDSDIKTKMRILYSQKMEEESTIS